jgi:anaerobic ribonucleoside-triphosphate reductase activating protein
MNYISIIDETITDGTGLRTSIYVSGCNHHCDGCHNPQTWSFEAGEPLTKELIELLIQNIKNNPLLNGVTFSGGDPLEVGNAESLLDFLKMFKHAEINVWCYTGYIYEDLLDMPVQKECLKYIDVLVDGPFIKELKDPDLIFRGSSNQRIIKLVNGIRAVD